ncbi:MAG: hypothetical protein KC421_13725, partial [Anaerolineales bacterium]|nr:hypothetical protein [Anaerolineales bacterium]
SSASPRLKLPKALVWPAIYTLEAGFGVIGRKPPFTRRSMKFFTGNTAFKTDKAANILGYRATVDLAEGIRRTYDWMKAKGSL